MRTKIFFGTILGLIVITFAGCDLIDAPYTVAGPNGCTVAEPSFSPRPAGDKVKKVLIEDITGHRCGNCPRAAETIHTIEGVYHEQVIAIGLHSQLSGDFTALYPLDTNLNPSQKYVYDFRTEVAREIDQYFGVSTIGLPNGMVNRKSYSGSTVVGYTTWSSKVASELSTPQVIDIQLKNYWTPADSSLCSFYYVEGMADLNSNYKICMFLLEDSLVHWQKDYAASPSTDLELYVHRHILRTSLNGTWGTPVNGGSSITTGGEYIDGFSINVDPSKWNIAQLYVVAFVYDEVTKEVLQAEQVKVMP